MKEAEWWVEAYAYKIKRKGKPKIWVILFRLFLAAVLVSLCIAGIWQYVQEKNEKEQGASSLNGVQMSSARERGVQSEASSAASVQEQLPQESLPEESSAVPPAVEEMKGAVLEGDAVESTYFDDAVFVGDSITEGFTIYSGMENATILAGTGINLSTVYTAQVIKHEDGSRSAIMDELAKAQYGKVYVMLGGNEVRDMPLESFLTRYAKVMEDIREMQPEAIIYVQSMTPVTANNNYNMDNDRIDMFNAAILQMCIDEGYLYLNVAQALKDENGMLPTEASPKDGMHFGQTQFNLWVDYLKRHAVEDEREDG